MASEDPQQPTGKGYATPKRKDQEAARRRPLVTDMKSDAKKRRAEARVTRTKEYEALRTGDERNMPPQHAGKVRRYVRDYIDARTTIAEFMLPVSMVALFILFFFGSLTEVVSISGMVLLLLFIAWIIESWIVIRRMKKSIRERFKDKDIPRLIGFYGFTRMLQIRRLRMPKPQVKRGEYPA